MDLSIIIAIIVIIFSVYAICKYMTHVANEAGGQNNFRSDEEFAPKRVLSNTEADVSYTYIYDTRKLL